MENKALRSQKLDNLPLILCTTGSGHFFKLLNNLITFYVLK